jgi:hypothetical protein
MFRKANLAAGAIFGIFFRMENEVGQVLWNAPVNPSVIFDLTGPQAPA